MKKYYGKEKCRILKEIRAEIARENDIEWVVSECNHQGNCKGTCPKCEQEVRQLEAALARREALGKTVAVVGISASVALSVTGCINPFPNTTAGVEPLEGEMLPPETVEETYTATAGEVKQPLQTDQESFLCETEMGEIAIPGEVVVDGEMPDETWTDDALMGDPLPETDSETDPETDPDEWEPLGGVPVEDVETESPDEEIMGEPVE